MGAVYEQGVPWSAADRHLRAGIAPSRERDRREVSVRMEDWRTWTGSEATSRLVTRGFKQHEGLDFGQTFAPTVSSSCVHLLSAIACELDLDLCHFDVDQALVQSYLDEDVFPNFAEMLR